MLNETKKYFFSRLLEDTFGYFNVYDYLKLNIKKTITNPVKLKSSKEFWECIFNPQKIAPGQIVKLKNFYLSEYIPKLPGKLWRPEIKKQIVEGYKEVVATTTDGKVDVLSLEGKRKIIDAGYGSVRLKPQLKGNFCTLLSAVSPDSWFSDSGIPIIVSKSVYSEFLKTNRDGAPWIEDLDGILFLNHEYSFLNNIPRAIGSFLSKETIDLLTNSPNLPKAFIYVPSPLNIKLRTNNTHPNVVAWTTFETSQILDPLRFTYSTFNPNKKGSLEYSIEFIKNYVKDFGGTHILTDFDGQIPRLHSKVNLNDSSKLKTNPVFNDIFKIINNWIEQEKGDQIYI